MTKKDAEKEWYWPSAEKLPQGQKLDEGKGGGVKGYEGNSECTPKGFSKPVRISFVGNKPTMRPTTGKEVLSTTDKFLYKTLDENGLGNAFLTDIVNRRGKAGEWDSDLKNGRGLHTLQDYLPKLEGKIKEKNPEYIVAMSGLVFNWFQILLAKCNMADKKLYYIRHPCSCGNSKGKEKFKEQLYGILKKIKENEKGK